jgi:hypothetical protein
MRPPPCALVLAAACGLAPAQEQPTQHQPQAWPEMDALFARDAHWLGGDAVYSVDLGGDRILWLFGDSFVGRDERRDRRHAAMVRNTIALQRGRDPARAALTFHWRTAGGEPAPFFAGDGALGSWPLQGHRVPGGPLLLFQTLVRDTPGEGLGFAIDGCRLVRVENPDVEPDAWMPRVVPLAGVPAGAVLGTAVAAHGEHLLVLGTRGNGPHRGLLARIALADLGRGDIRLQVRAGGAWRDAAPGVQPDDVLADAGPECSLHRAGDRWLHVYSRGFGATVVAAHAAREPQGPWSGARELFTPPESRGAAPFVYAGKAHPELAAGDGWLAVSYATNAFAFGDLFTPDGQQRRYWPRFWRVPLTALPEPPAAR